MTDNFLQLLRPILDLVITWRTAVGARAAQLPKLKVGFAIPVVQAVRRDLCVDSPDEGEVVSWEPESQENGGCVNAKAGLAVLIATTGLGACSATQASTGTSGGSSAGSSGGTTTGGCQDTGGCGIGCTPDFAVPNCDGGYLLALPMLCDGGPADFYSTAEVNQAVTLWFVAQCGTPPYTWSVPSSNGHLVGDGGVPLGLPSGLTAAPALSDPRVLTISGSPKEVGYYTFVVDVSDGPGSTGVAYVLHVVP